MIKFKRMFSTDSAKAIKADKYGFLNAINYMAPHTTAGEANLCSHSTAGCRDLCLGMYSGQASMVKDLEKDINNVRASRINKAKYFMEDMPAFLDEMTGHIKNLHSQADRKNKTLAVRLNGSTAIAFERIKNRDGKTMFDLFPNTQFIDYTKNPKRAISSNMPNNYHLTFSLSEENEADAIEVLKHGVNVAVVFESKPFPKKYLGYKVIDGTEHDLRHLDPQPVIVGLDPKGIKAKNDTSGFVVREYDHG